MNVVMKAMQGSVSEEGRELMEAGGEGECGKVAGSEGGV
jgi:hypothetical protein